LHLIASGCWEQPSADVIADQLLGKTWFGSEAVKRAGFRVKDNQGAAEVACKLLKKTEVKKAIDADYEPWAINIIEGIPISRITPEKIETFRPDSKMDESRLQLSAIWVAIECKRLVFCGPERGVPRSSGIGR
jgi:hypothetical protein